MILGWTLNPHSVSLAADTVLWAALVLGIPVAVIVELVTLTVSHIVDAHRTTATVSAATSLSERNSR